MTNLFHGSEIIIEHPQYKKGRYANDYGRGFYLTHSAEMAAEWACGSGQDGFVNEYKLDEKGLSVLDLNSGEYTILNWLAVLTKYRSYWQRASISERAKDYLQEHFFVDVEKFDVIKGYRADDSYFSFAQDFISNAISYRKLRQAMYLGELGEQTVLKSKKAFSKIVLVDYKQVDGEEYFEKRRQRDLQAKKDYRNLVGEADKENDLYMLDIMREGMRHGDPRLQ